MEINIRYVICGDFNYDLLKQEFNANINEFIDMSSSFYNCVSSNLHKLSLSLST